MEENERQNNPLQDVLSASEVDELWHKPKNTTSCYCIRGYFNSQEARKAKGTWLVTRKGARRVFGPIPLNYENERKTEKIEGK
jgi:hypothetical protein